MSPWNRLFLFESLWLENPDFLSKLEVWWKYIRVICRKSMKIFQLKLKELKGKINEWNISNFGNIHKEK